MFRSYTNEFKDNLRDKLDISEIINIVSSEGMENTSPKFQVWFCMSFSGVFSGKTLVSINYNKRPYVSNGTMRTDDDDDDDVHIHTDQLQHKDRQKQWLRMSLKAANETFFVSNQDDSHLENQDLSQKNNRPHSNHITWVLYTHSD